LFFTQKETKQNDERIAKHSVDLKQKQVEYNDESLHQISRKQKDVDNTDVS
jgi:hypothetical protein